MNQSNRQVHIVGIEVPLDFADVVRRAAEKSGRLFSDQLLYFAIIGADSQRLYEKKPDHVRTRRKK